MSHIRAVDVIYHMVRAFEDKNVTHVEESVDPLRDMDIIENELIKKDIETVKKALPWNACVLETTGRRTAVYIFNASRCWLMLRVERKYGLENGVQKKFLS